MAIISCTYSPATHDTKIHGRAAFTHFTTTFRTLISGNDTLIKKTVITSADLMALDHPSPLQLNDRITLYSLTTSLAYTGHLNRVVRLFPDWIDVEVTPCPMFNSHRFRPPPIFVRIQRNWIHLPIHFTIRYSLISRLTSTEQLPPPTFPQHLITLALPSKTITPTKATLNVYAILPHTCCLRKHKPSILLSWGGKWAEVEYHLTLPN
ncbi:hypothetical protein PAXINDRAFT_22425 [Paxillus involutus ATCC 200175]|uniref:Uncharacterized protein n=1 Tax=Paxillus involutus ATCC 200175 TaxID=664439 RepID=A0A0C9T7M4_PAXIN|nr:hypothetical protein PAXINDRAFT_22425 [Paxillus involutus ATCC 200175]